MLHSFYFVIKEGKVTIAICKVTKTYDKLMTTINLREYYRKYFFELRIKPQNGKILN